MAQTVFGLTRDNGDGSGSIVWFRNKEIVDKVLDSDQYEDFYANEGSPAMTLTFPDDLDLTECGFRFSDDHYG